MVSPTKADDDDCSFLIPKRGKRTKMKAFRNCSRRRRGLCIGKRWENDCDDVFSSSSIAPVQGCGALFFFKRISKKEGKKTGTDLPPSHLPSLLLSLLPSPPQKNRIPFQPVLPASLFLCKEAVRREPLLLLLLYFDWRSKEKIAALPPPPPPLLKLPFF